MNKLFIGFDFFCPGAFQGGALKEEDYAWDAETLFLVLQPSILTKGPDAADPAAFFQLDGADLGTTTAIRFLAGPSAASDIAAVDHSGVPVPLPPEAKLELSYLPKPGTPAQLQRRTLPSLDPAKVTCPELSLPCDQWPNFAEANFALPPLTSYAQVATVATDRRAALERTVESWAIAAAVAILDADREQKPLAASEQAALAGPLQTIKPLFSQDVSPTEQELRAHLRLPARDPLAGQLWTMLTKAPPGEKLLSPPPRLLHDRDSLAKDPVGLLGLGDAANPPPSSSYHRGLWLRLKTAAEAAAADPNPPAEGRFKGLSDMLGRLFAFGERLRWSTNVAGSDAFMLLKDESLRATALGWNAFGTNAHSLLGQVFRLPFTAATLDPAAELIVSVGSAVSIDIMPAIRELIADLLKAQVFSATLAADADRPQGFFLYAPRMAEATKVAKPRPLDPGSPAGGLPDPIETVYAVPAALLDAVDPTPRISQDELDDKLQRGYPVRSALRPSELYLPDALGARTQVLSLGARLSPVAVSAPKAGMFQLNLSAALHPDEEKEIRTRLAADAASGEIWVPSPGGAHERWRIIGRLLANGAGPEGGWRLTLADRDGTLAAYCAAAPAPAQGTERGTDAGIDVELLLPCAPAAPLFNRLLTIAAPIAAAPLCILNARFTSQVSRSTDRLLDRFESSLSPSPLDASPGPLTLAFGNFDKLRLSLASTDPAVTSRWESPGAAALTGPVAETYLTYPDAAAPLDDAGYSAAAAPWTVAAPPSKARFKGYYVGHGFTQDSRADDVSARADAKAKPDKVTARNKRVQNAAEALRYINYLTPATPWTMQGYLEHQYSYRVAVTGRNLTLPLTTAIVHPGQAVQGEAADGGKDAIKTPLVEWRFDEAAATVILNFPTRYLQQAIRESGDIRPARLRAIYEPLAELLLAIDEGVAYLRLQGWSFSTQDATKALAADENDDGGDIASNMLLDFALTHKLAAADLHDLKPARDLLALPFSQFEAAVVALAANGAAKPIWMKLAIAVKAPEWDGLGTLQPKDIRSVVDLLRLGLSLARPDSHVIPPSPPLAPGFPLDPDEAQREAYPALKQQSYAPLWAAAAAELAAFTELDHRIAPHPSPLRRKFAWLRSAPEGSTTTTTTQNSEQLKDPRRFTRLFGATAAVSIYPTAPRPPVATVMDLFYVPLAFRPLRAHPDIGDPATTLDFAEFLIRALDDLATGRSDPAGIALLATTPDAAYLAIADLRDQLLPPVAKALADLLHWVHQDPDASASALLTHVHDRTVAALTATGRGAFERMLLQAPSLFLTSQGFGFVLVDKADWINRLHSLQIRKRIEPDTVLARERGDVDKFNFRSFFGAGPVNGLIDVLDDSRYDTEFEIDRPAYKTPRKVWTVADHGTMRRDQVAKIGQVQARTGEDIIRTANAFDSPGADQPPGTRALLVDPMHWNENWVRSGPQPLYLLPSRRFPAMPLKVARADAEDVASQPSMLQIDLSKPKPDANAQLTAQLAQQGADKPVKLALGTDSQFAAEPMTHPASYRARITDAVATDPKKLIAPGWWAVDTYVSEHFFIIEDGGEKPGAPFTADIFEIVTQIGTAPFGEEPIDPPPSFQPADDVGRWFQYLRLKNSTPDADPPRPSDMAIEDLIANLTSWLLPAQPEKRLLRVDEPVAPFAAPQTIDVFTSFTVSANPADPYPETAALKEVQRDGADLGVGAVLLAEVLSLTLPNATKAKQPTQRYVLRVVMLDDRWRYSRVRVRIVRNARDVNKDFKPDINTVFRLVGAYSAWSSQQLVTGLIDFTALDRIGKPADLTDLRPTITLAKFRGGPEKLLDYGKLVESSLSASVLDNFNRPLPLWNAQPGPDLSAAGMVLQKRHDLHPRYGTTDLSVTSRGGVPGRVGERPLQHLAVARQYVTLQIDRELVLSPFHQIRVTWSRNGMPVMSCTWPVFFQP